MADEFSRDDGRTKRLDNALARSWLAVRRDRNHPRLLPQCRPRQGGPPQAHPLSRDGSCRTGPGAAGARRPTKAPPRCPLSSARSRPRSRAPRPTAAFCRRRPSCRPARCRPSRTGAMRLWILGRSSAAGCWAVRSTRRFCSVATRRSPANRTVPGTARSPTSGQERSAGDSELVARAELVLEELCFLAPE